MRRGGSVGAPFSGGLGDGDEVCGPEFVTGGNAEAAVDDERDFADWPGAEGDVHGPVMNAGYAGTGGSSGLRPPV